MRNWEEGETQCRKTGERRWVNSVLIGNLTWVDSLTLGFDRVYIKIGSGPKGWAWVVFKWIRGVGLLSVGLVWFIIAKRSNW